MQLCQIRPVTASFDEPNLISSAGLVPVMHLARRAGLVQLVTEKLSMAGGAGADAAAKVASIIAGMISGADSIDDLGVLREGAVHKVMPGVKAPSTLGTFLRAFTFGHVRQLGSVAAALLVTLAAMVTLLPASPEAKAVTWLDVDDTMRETYGYFKEGVGYGYNKVKGLNALLAMVSTAVSAPIIVAHRLRRGPVSSARGAGKFLADAIAAARRTGASAVIRCRLDSAFYNHKVIGAIRTAGAQFSITAKMDPAICKAIAGIDEARWVSIKYPKAIFDQEQQRWISDAQVAETTYTAFTSAAKTHQVTARLIVRRVKRLNPKAGPQGQGELFTVYRFHAVFTDSTESTLTAEAQHRDHAIVEQVIADLKGSALAHFPDVRPNQRKWCLVGLHGDGLLPQHRPEPKIIINIRFQDQLQPPRWIEVQLPLWLREFVWRVLFTLVGRGRSRPQRNGPARHHPASPQGLRGIEQNEAVQGMSDSSADHAAERSPAAAVHLMTVGTGRFGL